MHEATQEVSMISYYACPGIMTQADERFARLTGDTAEQCQILHGLLLHPVEAQHYGVRLARSRWKELALRDATAKLQRIDELAALPLETPRPPDQRLLGNCRDFALMLCAILRAHGIPARVRYGVATYWHADFFTDHVICEYWRNQEWIRVDALVDEVLTRVYHLHCNPLHLADTEFLVAGQVWQRYRQGLLAADQVGLLPSGPRGLAFIYDGMLHDLASLQKVEPLCQDTYEQIDGLDWDQVAGWTCAPEESQLHLQRVFNQIF